MSIHFMSVCEFGLVHGQCRCPSPGKSVRSIECDRREEHDPSILKRLRDEAEGHAASSSLAPTSELQVDPEALTATKVEVNPKFQVIPPHSPESLKFEGKECEYLANGVCYWCCTACNFDRHQCPGCGEPLDHNGNETTLEGEKKPHGISCVL